jgi:hypothetical protein
VYVQALCVVRLARAPDVLPQLLGFDDAASALRQSREQQELGAAEPERLPVTGDVVVVVLDEQAAVVVNVE